MDTKQESRHRQGSRRHSGIYEQGERSIQRRTSKKSSSQDRRGQVYPEDFREETLQAIPAEPAVQSTASQDDSSSRTQSHKPPRSLSPHLAPQSRPQKHRDVPQHLHRRKHRQYSSNGDVTASRSPSRTQTIEEPSKDTSPVNIIAKSRQRVGYLQSPVDREENDNASSIAPRTPPTPGQAAISAAVSNKRKSLRPKCDVQLQFDYGCEQSSAIDEDDLRENAWDFVLSDVRIWTVVLWVLRDQRGIG
ncbi:MAG: hypothetical protein Q9222_003480 [Ikaeria aurantiellina]